MTNAIWSFRRFSIADLSVVCESAIQTVIFPFVYLNIFFLGAANTLYSVDSSSSDRNRSSSGTHAGYMLCILCSSAAGTVSAAISAAYCGPTIVLVLYLSI